ncbi:MAG: Bacterial rane protein YfhO [Chloroflexi bacterium]|nr:Bacterial rane protein YfhO [Chloroflexota bacterium]
MRVRVRSRTWAAPRSVVRHPAFWAGFLAILLVAVTYGPGVARGNLLIPLDILDVFVPWNADRTPVAPSNGLIGDQVQQMYPWRAFAHHEIAAGRLPLWNPYGGGGTPLFANGQAALLFPLNVLTLWLAPEWAATLVQLAKPPLAAVGGALFLRALGASGVASVFGGLAWAFSGPMVVWLGWPHTNALLMVPYIFWTATRWLQRATAGWWAAHAAAVAVGFFGGHPETSAHTLFLLGIFVLVWVLGMSQSHVASIARRLAPGLFPQGSVRSSVVLDINAGGVDADHGLEPTVPPASLPNPLMLGAGWLAAALVGILLASVQVVPTLAAVADSVTASERSSGALGRLVLPVETVLTWAVPNIFGSPLTETVGSLRYFSYLEVIGYVGLGVLLLACMSLLALRRPGWAGIALLTLVAAGLTYGLPVITELRRIPGLGHAANTRFVYMLAFGLVCLAAFGLDACRQGYRRWPLWIAFSLAAAASAASLGFGLAPERLLPTTAADANPLTPLGVVNFRQSELWRTAGIALLWCGALGGLLLSPMAKRVGRRASDLSFLLIAALAIDLLVFGAGMNTMLPRDTLDAVPGAISAIQSRDPGGRVIGLGEALLPNTAMLFGLQDLRVYEPVADRRILGFFERLDPLHMRDAKARFYLFVRQPNLDLLGIAGVRWVISEVKTEGLWTPGDLEAGGLIQRYRDDTTSVWEHPNARPWAYFASTVQMVGTESESLEATTGLSGLQPLATVIQDPNAAPDLPQPDWTAAGAGQVTGKFMPGEARIGVDAPQAGWLVVNSTLYAGWSAQVDGFATPIYRANYLFMGIPIPAGHHVVRLEYRPVSFLLGVGLTACGVLILGAVLAWVSVRRRTVH